MSKSEYLVQIADMTTATQLHALAVQASSDGELLTPQRNDVRHAILARFCELNAAATVNRKPRWS